MIRIRKATPRDAVRIRNVHRASILGVPPGEYTPEQIAAWGVFRKAAAYRRVMAGGEVMFIALEIPRAGAAPRTAGFSGVKGSHICAVYVRPGFAGRGVGRRLLRAAEREVLRQGHAAADLDSSLNAVAFYEKMGYRRGRKALHPLRDGIFIPCFRMKKRLIGKSP